MSGCYFDVRMRSFRHENKKLSKNDTKVTFWPIKVTIKIKQKCFLSFLTFFLPGHALDSKTA